MEEEKDQLIKRVERLKKRVRQTFQEAPSLLLCWTGLRIHREIKTRPQTNIISFSVRLDRDWQAASLFQQGCKVPRCWFNGSLCRPCQKVQPDSVRSARLLLLTMREPVTRLRLVDPPGGVSPQSSANAGTGQTAASGEGERGVTDSPEARTEEPSKWFTFTSRFVTFVLIY